MCGRFNLVVPDLDELRRYMNIDDIDVNGWVPRYNIAPSQLAPTLRLANDGRRRIELLQWGLLRHSARDASVARPINARIETLQRQYLAHGRVVSRPAIVPATGYYEWQASGARKQPWLISPASGLLAMAAVWDRWLSRDGEVIETFAVVTDDAPAALKHIHSRSPLLLEANQVDDWLNGRWRRRALSSVANTLQATPISARVSSPANDDAALLEPVPLAASPQLAFDLPLRQTKSR